MERVWIKNAYIVNEGKCIQGSVVIEGDKIAEIWVGNEQPVTECSEVIDAKGSYLIPGVIDNHVHFRDPGLTHKGDITTESYAAVAGGVTSYMDMPNTHPQTTTLEALEEKHKEAAKKSIANYSFYFGATNGNADLLSKLDKRKVCGIKLFMGSSTGNMLVDRKEVLRKLFKEAPMLIAAHCEDQAIVLNNTKRFKELYGEDPEVKHHPEIRSTEACVSSSTLAIELARESQAKLHLLHVSTAQELDLFEDKPLKEKRITAEACVAHLFFCNEDYERLGTKIKCNPAIKNKTDQEALQKVLNSNRIDVIGTDHAPHLLSEKEGGALKAVSGMPMIQFSLVTMMELVHNKTLTIEQLVQKMCHAPAELFQIKERGYIRPGYKADLVLVNPNQTWELTPETVMSKCQWSPLEGYTFRSRVEKTFVNGKLAYSDGVVNAQCRGEALTFER
ncbi:MAG: dihydroorotase [Phocaeicola sp.]